MGIRTVCCYIPRELLEAFGLDAPRLIPTGSVASESKGEALSGPGACSWCKSALDSEDAEALLIGGATCDQMRRALELAGRASGNGPIIICVPKTRTTEAENLYLEELKWMAAEIGRRTGRTLDSAALRRAIDAHDRLRRRIRELRLALSGADFTALVHLHAALSAEKMNAYLDNHPPPSARRPGIPILVAGSPVAPSEVRWLRLLEDAGLSVIADATCTGDRAIALTINPAAAEDPFEALGRAYFRRPACLFIRPNDEFYDYAAELIETRGIRAVVWRSLRGCDIWGLEIQRAERLLRRPLLSLDMSFGDADSMRIRTRIEAFAESLR